MSGDDGRGGRADRRNGGSTTSQHGTPMAVDIAAPPQARRALTLFVAGPVVWFAHFMVVYVVAEAGCTGDGTGLRLLDPPVPTVVTLAATAVAAVACAAIAWWEYQRWQAGRRPMPAAHTDDVPESEDPEIGGTLAFAGFLLAVVSLLSVLFVGLPAAVLPAC
ncbi:MAG: hypothetical protein KY460_16760 [Actinobacteria bacterium]|nr:hypothetical protein [Actinomycetota bacterium]